MNSGDRTRSGGGTPTLAVAPDESSPRGLPSAPAPAEARDVLARGARIRVSDVGAGEALLLVHDLLADHRAFEAVRPFLPPGMRVVIPDLPGSGASEKPSPSRFDYTPASFADALVDVVAALGLGRVTVVGHGLGALTALTLAAQHPSLVQRLVLVAPPIDGLPRGPFARLISTPLLGPFFFNQLLTKSSFRALFRRQLHGFVGVGVDERIRAHYASFNSPAARAAAFAAFRASLDSRSVVALLPRVGAKTLVVAGRTDPLTAPASGRRLARTLPHARFEVLDCGHAPAEEIPAALGAAIRAFCSEARDE